MIIIRQQWASFIAKISSFTDNGWNNNLASSLFIISFLFVTFVHIQSAWISLFIAEEKQYHVSVYKDLRPEVRDSPNFTSRFISLLRVECTATTQRPNIVAVGEPPVTQAEEDISGQRYNEEHAIVVVFLTFAGFCTKKFITHAVMFLGVRGTFKINNLHYNMIATWVSNMKIFLLTLSCLQVSSNFCGLSLSLLQVWMMLPDQTIEFWGKRGQCLYVLWAWL